MGLKILWQMWLSLALLIVILLIDKQSRSKSPTVSLAWKDRGTQVKVRGTFSFKYNPHGEDIPLPYCIFAMFLL